MTTLIKVHDALAARSASAQADALARMSAQRIRKVVRQAEAQLNALATIELTDDVDESSTRLMLQFEAAVDAVRSLFSQLDMPFDFECESPNDLAWLLWTEFANGADARTLLTAVARVVQAQDTGFRHELSRLCIDLADQMRRAFGRWQTANSPLLHQRGPHSDLARTEPVVVRTSDSSDSAGRETDCDQSHASDTPTCGLRENIIQTPGSGAGSPRGQNALSKLSMLAEAEAAVRARVGDERVVEQVLNVLLKLDAHRGKMLPAGEFVKFGVARSTLHEASTSKQWSKADAAGSGTSVRSYSVDRVIGFVTHSWSPRRTAACDRNSDAGVGLPKPPTG